MILQASRQGEKKYIYKTKHQEAKWHLTSQKQHQKLIENVEIEECLYNLRENYFQPIIPYQSNHQSSESWIRFSAHFFFLNFPCTVSQEALEDVHPQNRKARKQEAWNPENRIYIKEAKENQRPMAKKISEMTAGLIIHIIHIGEEGPRAPRNMLPEGGNKTDIGRQFSTVLLHFVHWGEQRHWWPLFHYLFKYVCTENSLRR